MIEILVDKITGLISLIGYLGVFLLMMLESTMIPIPSELVMPFAGFLVASGKMNFIALIIVAVLASLIGSLISYFIGHRYSKHVIRKFGKYLLLDEKHLDKAENWFKAHGGKTIFFSRFVPGLRHVISIPAGTGKMDLFSFSFFTFIGAGIWNTFLAYLGFVLEKNWKIISQYSSYVDMILIFIIAALLVYYIVKMISVKNHSK